MLFKNLKVGQEFTVGVGERFDPASGGIVPDVLRKLSDDLTDNTVAWDGTLMFMLARGHCDASNRLRDPADPAPAMV